MSDSLIREFVAKQRELLDLELQSEASEEKNGKDEEERPSHTLGGLEAADISVGLYGRTVVQLSAWSEKARSGKESLLPAHRLTVGDEVEIRCKQIGNKRGYPGGVISAVSDTSVSVALFPEKNQQGKKRTNDAGPDDDDDNTDGLGAPPLTLVPRSSADVHRKMLLSLESLERHGANHAVAGGIIQGMFERNPSAAPPPSTSRLSMQPYNTNLDQSQLDAISFALQSNRPIALIHGPPGTGKTTTIAELIHQAVRVHGMKVLVTAPSNVAVDNILERLVANPTSAEQAKSKGQAKSSKGSLRAVRLGHPARIKSSILSYSLEAQVQTADGTEIVADVRKELQSFLRVMSNPKSQAKDKRLAYGEIKALRREVRTREEKVVQTLISTSQVVLATTVGAANRILDKVEGGFDLVVIDEAAQALEASCWIPILRGRKVVLAGDHCQLPPTIKSKNHKVQAGLAVTMFERLMKLYGDDGQPKEKQIPIISRMLKVQYRMHHDIANWASQAMYGGELLTHESVGNRTLMQLETVKKACDSGGDSSLAETILLLVDTAGCDMYETVNSAGSRFNKGEANIVYQHVKKLLGLGMQQQQLAIITPYNGQVELLRNMMLPDFPKLEIRSVDGFQGGERDAVILSLVRSSDRGGKDGIGFLRDDRRQNVGVTRAMRHLAVVCDTETVAQSKFIASLISWIEDHGEQQSAMQYLSTTHETEMEDALQNAESELLKLVEATFDEKNKPSKKVAPSNSNSNPNDRSIEEAKRKSLMDKIAVFTENGRKGEEMILSSELSSYDRRLIHEFAEQMGLGHRSEGENNERRIILNIQYQTQQSGVTESSGNVIETNENINSEEFASKEASPFIALAAEDSDSESSSVEESPEVAVQVNSEIEYTPSGNSLLTDLAQERAERQAGKESKPSTSPGKKKKEAQMVHKLGGAKKQNLKEEDNLDDLDDMAFLDAQINKAQNAHGRKVTGEGKNYKTIVNVILNSRPEVHVKPSNARAAASLQSKLKDAQKARKPKNNKKKKK